MCSEIAPVCSLDFAREAVLVRHPHRGPWPNQGSGLSNLYMLYHNSVFGHFWPSAAAGLIKGSEPGAVKRPRGNLTESVL